MMRTLRFLTLPTLLGWLAACLTCCGLLLLMPHSMRVGNERSVGSVEDIGIGFIANLMVGGFFIVLPTYVLVILPLSIWTLRTRVMSVMFYVGALLLAGLIATLHFRGMGNPVLFYLPFVPYAAVVAWAAWCLRPWDCSAKA